MSKDKKQKSLVSRRSFLQKSATVAVAAPVVGAVIGVTVAEAAPAPAAPAAPAPAPAAPAKAPKKYLFAERASCTGCRACEYACSQYHEKGVTRPALSRIYVRRYKGIADVPIICWHCEDAPCVRACPTTPKAIVKDKDTNIISFIDDKTCLGAKCNKCMEACPAQYLRRNPDTGMPMFCDLCGGDPQCVQACERMAAGELAPTLTAKKSGGGVNIAYRDVTPDEAAEALIMNYYYPNSKGDRR